MATHKGSRCPVCGLACAPPAQRRYCSPTCRSVARGRRKRSLPPLMVLGGKVGREVFKEGADGKIRKVVVFDD